MERVLLVLIVLGVALSLVAECCGGEAKKPAGSVDYGGYRPHYQGFGINTKGGRGGQVLRVTNLNDNGPGSLRAALETEGPRFVIFDISGTIALESPLRITHPFVTIAGQTAPSPGINLRNWSLSIETHDVVVQHLRLRMGDTHCPVGSEPTIRISNGRAREIVLDHVSVAWAMDMGLRAMEYPYNDIGKHPTHISLLDCIFAFPLARGYSNGYDYSGYGVGMGHMGATIEDNQYTYARNLFVHSSYRNPVIGVGQVQLINDVVYGSGPWTPSDDQWAYQMYWQNQGSGSDRNPNGASQGVIINTYTIDSQGTGSGITAGSGAGMKCLSFDFAQDNIDNQDTKIWLYGNQGPGITGPDLAGQKTGIYWVKSRGGQDCSNADIWYKEEPAWHSETHFRTIPTDQVCDYVLANVGARPLDRDPVDVAAISQTKAGLIDDLAHMGSRVASQEDMGGHPKLAVNTRVLKIPDNPNAIAPGQKFRTNIEMWLEKLARDLEPAQGGKATLTAAPATTTAPAAPAIVKDAVSLAVTPASVLIREPVTVSFTGRAHATTADWIGLFYKGAGNESCIYWRYTSSGTLLPGDTAHSQGSFEFAIPPIAGAYEFRLFANNSYLPLATSEPVTVSKPQYRVRLTASPDVVSPGEKVTVTHRHMPSLDGGKWVGLYKADADDNSYKEWKWTNGEAEGSLTFTMPAEPGTYNFRIFGGGEKLATSKPVTVK